MYHGDFFPGATVRFMFNTSNPSTNSLVTLADTPAVRVYKDDSTTEDDSGITLNVDFDSRTGLHLVEIDTSADGTFYSAGSDFSVVLTAGTVGGLSAVGAVIGTFSIANRPVNVEQVAGQTATPDATLVDDIVNGVFAETVDGVAFSKIAQILLAANVGKVTVTDNGATRTFTFFAQNGTTELFEITASDQAADAGARAATGTIDPP